MRLRFRYRGIFRTDYDSVTEVAFLRQFMCMRNQASMKLLTRFENVTTSLFVLMRIQIKRSDIFKIEQSANFAQVINKKGTFKRPVI